LRLVSGLIAGDLRIAFAPVAMILSFEPAEPALPLLLATPAMGLGQVIRWGRTIGSFL
jgi:hypothetical protein